MKFWTQLHWCKSRFKLVQDNGYRPKTFQLTLKGETNGPLSCLAVWMTILPACSSSSLPVPSHPTTFPTGTSNGPSRRTHLSYFNSSCLLVITGALPESPCSQLLLWAACPLLLAHVRWSHTNQWGQMEQKVRSGYGKEEEFSAKDLIHKSWPYLISHQPETYSVKRQSLHFSLNPRKLASPEETKHLRPGQCHKD